MNEIKKIAVLTSGGDAPGMNSAVRAVVFSANNLGIEVVGVLRGYEGLIDWETIPLGLDDVRNINNQGGTILFTSRSERFLDQKYRHTAAENLRAHDVDAVSTGMWLAPNIRWGLIQQRILRWRQSIRSGIHRYPMAVAAS